jgi:hypothetical protein
LAHKQHTQVRVHKLWLRWLYFNLAVHREYLSPGRMSSTSTALYAATTNLPVAQVLHQLRRAPRILVSRLHGLYLNLVMRRPAARLLVGWLHWLSPCVWSLRLATRLLVVRNAPALLRLCRASGRAILTLDFSLVGRTGSRRASGHCVSRRDYSSSVLHRLYYAYAMHPEAPSPRSTSRQLVALAHVCAWSFRCAS